MGLIKIQNSNSKISELFLNDLCNTIEFNNKVYKPSASYKPSSLKCIREMFFMMKQFECTTERDDYTLIGILQVGSDRHTRLQNVIKNMNNFQYIDIENYIKENNLKDLKVIKKFENETLIKNVKYNMNLMTDGIIKHNNNYYILEIKTENSKKFYDRCDVDESHYNQAICYSICFDIDEVLFIYENRDLLEKKCYTFQVTNDMKNKIIKMIDRCNYYVDRSEIPPKPAEYSTKFCQYCKYKKICRGV